MSLFKKPKRNIQRRVFGSNEDEEPNEEKRSISMDVDQQQQDENGSGGVVFAPKLPKIKSQKDKKNTHSTTTAKSALLSFETEEEGEVFQVKKSSHSKKIMKLMDKERQKKKSKEKYTDAFGSDEKSIKTEDNNQQHHHHHPKHHHTEIITEDLVMVVKKHEINSTTSNDHHQQQQQQILNGRAALCAGRDDVSSEEDEDDGGGGGGGSRSRGHKYSHPDSVKIVLEAGQIPDAAMIHAARKRRQWARELGGDYVPLEDGGANGQQQQQQQDIRDKGRLIREDEHDASDDERIDMSVNVAARDRDQRREQFLAAQDDESEHETDKEMEEWENQQIRKGVTGAQIMAAGQESIFNQFMPNANVAVAQPIPDFTTVFSAIPTSFDPSSGPKTPQMVVQRLKERLEAVRVSHAQHAVELDRAETDLDKCECELVELKGKAPVAAKRFRFYQELRGYVTDLVECLDEKVGVIAKLEEKAMDLYSKRAERLVERRRQDIRDQADEVTQKPGSRKGIEDETRVRRTAEREGRRSRRRRARETPGHPKHIEGMSSDDELPQQEIVNFESQKEQLRIEADNIFEDVTDDFANVANILGKFEQWRDVDMTAYSEAYASLCVPKVVSPLLRLSLMFWNPLNETSDVDKFKWYTDLVLYGLQKGETERTLAEDPDVNLVPTVVDKIILPKLTQIVDKCWDPMSTSQTLRLVGLVGRYIRRYPTLGPESKTLTNLFNAILHKLKQALEHDIFIPMFSKQTVESKSPFFSRQFAGGLKLLRNITSWQGVLNENMLKDLALGSLLNRYLLNGLRVCQLTDAISKAGLISHILPRVWLQNETPQLQLFITTVTNLAGQLDKDNPLHLESMEVAANIMKSLRSA